MKKLKKLGSSLLLVGFIGSFLLQPVCANENLLLHNNLFPSFLTIEEKTTDEWFSFTETDTVQVKQLTTTLDGQSTTIPYAKILFDTPWNADICVAQTAVGQSEELLSMATRTNAVLAINGSAYQNFDTTKLADPYGTIISKNKIIHADSTNLPVLIIGTNGSFAVNQLKLNLKGSVGSTVFTFDAINHTPNQSSDTITFFDKNRGNSVGFAYGTNYIVQNNIIVAIQTNTDSAIPDDGFVVNVIGNQKLQNKLEINSTVNYSFSCRNRSLSTIQAAVAIENLLVDDAEVVTQENTIANTTPLIRSAIGITTSGDVVAVAGVKATASQLANIMYALDCKIAVSFNSGTASGLTVEADYLVASDEKISNALVFKINK